jgi:hypothetical protein
VTVGVGVTVGVLTGTDPITYYVSDILISVAATISTARYSNSKTHAREFMTSVIL